MKFFEKRWLHGYSFMTLLAKTKQQQGKSKTARLSDEHKRASYLAYFWWFRVHGQTRCENAGVNSKHQGALCQQENVEIALVRRWSQTPLVSVWLTFAWLIILHRNSVRRWSVFHKCNNEQ